MITPDKQARRKVIAKIGHELPSEPSTALFTCAVSFMKNAIPGASTRKKNNKH